MLIKNKQIDCNNGIYAIHQKIEHMDASSATLFFKFITMHLIIKNKKNKIIFSIIYRNLIKSSRNSIKVSNIYSLVLE